MYEFMRKKLENLPKNAIVFVIISPQHQQDMNIFLLKYWMDLAKRNGAYISLNRPYGNLLDTLNMAKIDPNKLFFIDCVTKNEYDVPNCYFLKSQQNLSNLSIAVSTVMKTEKPSFVFCTFETSSNSKEICCLFKCFSNFSISSSPDISSKPV